MQATFETNRFKAMNSSNEEQSLVGLLKGCSLLMDFFRVGYYLNALRTSNVSKIVNHLGKKRHFFTIMGPTPASRKIVKKLRS